jgi:hypothetical protein
MPGSTTTSFETAGGGGGLVGERTVRLRRLDREDVGRGAARGDDLRLGVAVHVVQLARHRVQPGLAARLRPAVDQAQVHDLLGRHALDLLVSPCRNCRSPGWRLRIQ